MGGYAARPELTAGMRRVRSVRKVRPVYGKVPLNARIRRDLREGMAAALRVWQHQAKLRGEDADEIDITFVLEEMLESQLELEWSFFETTKRLNGPPKTDEQWKELLAEVTAKVKAEQQTK